MVGVIIHDGKHRARLSREVNFGGEGVGAAPDQSRLVRQVRRNRVVARPTSTSGTAAVGVSACGPVSGNVRMDIRFAGTPSPVTCRRRPSSGIAATFVAVKVTFVNARTVDPMAREFHCHAGVGHTKAVVVADEEPGAVRRQVRVREVKMSRRENQDLLHIAIREVRIGRKQQRGDAGDVRCGGGGAGKSLGIEHVISAFRPQADARNEPNRDLIHPVCAQQIRCEQPGWGCVEVPARCSDQHTGAGVAVTGGASVNPHGGDGDHPRIGRVTVVIGVPAERAVVSCRTNNDGPQSVPAVAMALEMPTCSSKVGPPRVTTPSPRLQL